jgi:hypothetical protein
MHNCLNRSDHAQLVAERAPSKADRERCANLADNAGADVAASASDHAGLTGGTRRDVVIAVIREDRRTIHMVDDDGIFHSILTGPDTMEMCRIEVTADSRIVGCRQLTRQR